MSLPFLFFLLQSLFSYPGAYGSSASGTVSQIHQFFKELRNINRFFVRFNLKAHLLEEFSNLDPL